MPASRAVAAMRETRQLAAALLLASILAVHLHPADVQANTLGSEARRFPRTHISEAEWHQFLAETKAKRNAYAVERKDVTRIVIRQERAVYFFTKPGHAAHPAAVRRAVVSYAKKSYIHTIGYYAGDQLGFRAWLEQFREQDRAIQRDLKQQDRPFTTLAVQISSDAL